ISAMITPVIPSVKESAVAEIAALCGARWVDAPHGPQTVFDVATGPGHRAAATADEPAPPDGVALLVDWGIVSASGADAVAFLQGQTTNDVAAQAADELRLNGYCTPKGRLLAGGPQWRDGDTIRLAVSRPLAAPLRKRLAMYVLRAKATITDDSDAFAVLGLAGEAAGSALREFGIEPPAPMKVARAEGTAMLALGLPEVAGFGPRWWLIVPVESLAPTWSRLTA